MERRLEWRIEAGEAGEESPQGEYLSPEFRHSPSSPSPSTTAPHSHLDIVHPPGVHLLSQQHQMTSIYAATMSRAQDDCIHAPSALSGHEL